MRITLLLALFLFTFSGNAEEAKPAYEPTSEYDQRELAGFKILISRKALPHQATLKEALELLEKKLGEINTLVGKAPLEKLKKCPIWIEWELLPVQAARAHHSTEWLRNNGVNPEKAGSVEISNLKSFIAWTNKEQPMMVLHELAHYYQQWHRGGADDADVKPVFDAAAKGGKYNEVDYVNGGKKRAYALNNSFEYFAELTEAYFGKNDFYPFTADDLAKHDPDGFKLMEKVWGKLEPTK